MKNIRIAILSLSMIISSQISFAQPVPGDDGPGSPCEYLPPEFQPDDCVPVDDYMYVLALAGMLLVAKNRKKIFA
jgi:hypothetical protein